MGTARSTYRTGAHLGAILDETGDWVANDWDGLIIGGVLASLRDALRAAARYSAGGEGVRAVCRLPPDSIIVFAGQMGRLTKLLP